MFTKKYIINTSKQKRFTEKSSNIFLFRIMRLINKKLNADIV